MDEIGLSVAAIHAHVLGLQALFLKLVDAAAIDPLHDSTIDAASFKARIT